MPKFSPQSLSSDEVIQILLEGNRRFISRASTMRVPSESEMESLAKKQSPIAVVISCSDSRVSPEIVFDQSLGRLFVNRNAGNVINSDVLASIEIAVLNFGTPLIVLMGHRHCSAVTVSLAEVASGKGIFTHIASLGKKILGGNRRVYKAFKNSSSEDNLDHTKNLDDAITYNVLYGLDRIRSTPYLSSVVARNRLKIIGAIYDIETGKIRFLDA